MGGQSFFMQNAPPNQFSSFMQPAMPQQYMQQPGGDMNMSGFGQGSPCHTHMRYEEVPTSVRTAPATGGKIPRIGGGFAM